MPSEPKIDQPALLDSEPASAEPTSGQWWTRPARTALQIGVVLALVNVYQQFAAVPLTTGQVEAITGLGTVIINIAQVVIEDAAGVAVLRTPAAKAHG